MTCEDWLEGRVKLTDGFGAVALKPRPEAVGVLVSEVNALNKHGR